MKRRPRHFFCREEGGYIIRPFVLLLRDKWGIYSPVLLLREYWGTYPPVLLLVECGRPYLPILAVGGGIPMFSPRM